jgi:hypothetical protein
MNLLIWRYFFQTSGFSQQERVRESVTLAWNVLYPLAKYYCIHMNVAVYFSTVAEKTAQYRFLY